MPLSANEIHELGQTLYGAFELHIDNDDALIRYLEGLEGEISASATPRLESKNAPRSTHFQT